MYWQAIQREFCKVPAPSFLVYYRFRLTSSPQVPLFADESAGTNGPKTDAPEGEQIWRGESLDESREFPADEGERFIALVRFAVIASKGQQEWLSSGGSKPLKPLITSAALTTDSLCCLLQLGKKCCLRVDSPCLKGSVAISFAGFRVSSVEMHDAMDLVAATEKPNVL